MNNQLEEFIKIYPSLNNEFCKKIITELKDASWQQHFFYNPYLSINHNVSGNKELDISYSDIPSKEELKKKIWETIGKYISDLNKPYYNSWSGFTNIRFNKYKESRLMALHCDHISDIFDGERKGIPTLTVLGLLNDDFDGGEFLMFNDEKQINLKIGDIIIFPSIFLYPHKVAPVTKGTRNTFVAWVW